VRSRRQQFGQYGPATVAAIAEADRVYMRAWLDAQHEFDRIGDLSVAMEAYNISAGHAAAVWKQTVKEAIERDLLF